MSGRILVIAEQQRLQRLFEGVPDIHLHTITVVTGLTGASEHLEHGAPELILLQDRLSGLSGELIVRHLRSCLKGAATVIVLATDAVDHLGTLADSLQVLDTSLPDQELVRQLERLVSRFPREQRELPFDGGAPVPAAAPSPTHPEAPPEPDLSGALADGVLSTSGEDLLQPCDTPGEADRGSPEAGPAPPATAGVASRFAEELETELARLEPVKGPGAAIPDADPALTVDEMLTAAAPSPPSATGRRLAAAAALGALALALLLWYAFRPEPTSTAVVRQGPAPVVPAGQAAPQPPRMPAPAPGGPEATPQPPLPRIVAAARPVHDPAYRADNPGWERYLTPNLDFRLFREGTTLKALQVMDRGGAGVPTRIFSGAMEELARVRDYKTEAREMKGSYLVKRGRLGSGARIIIYKDRQDEVLHGFVIHFN